MDVVTEMHGETVVHRVSGRIDTGTAADAERTAAEAAAEAAAAAEQAAREARAANQRVIGKPPL